MAADIMGSHSAPTRISALVLAALQPLRRLLIVVFLVSLVPGAIVFLGFASALPSPFDRWFKVICAVWVFGSAVVLVLVVAMEEWLFAGMPFKVGTIVDVKKGSIFYGRRITVAFPDGHGEERLVIVETGVPDNLAGLATPDRSVVARCTPKVTAARIDWQKTARRFGTKELPTDTSEPSKRLRPQIALCPRCGASLDLDAEHKGHVRCEYCQASVKL